MHPIEHLRYLARADDTDPRWIIPEAAEALSGLVDDRNALVMGSRMLLEHLGTCGPLWWLCSRMLDAADTAEAIDETCRRFEDDPTTMYASLAISDLADDADAVVMTAAMVGPTGFVAVGQRRSRRHDEAAGDHSRPIWLVAGEGTVVDQRIFAVATTRSRAATVVALDQVARVIGPTGVGSVDVLERRVDVPFVPELLPRA